MITSPTTTTTTTTTSSSSPIIIPVSSVVHVLGRNYDESILLTSKYNQSLLRDRRLRQSNIVDSQTGIHQRNSSLYHKTTDRLKITRTDQVYVYPRRIYHRHIRHNPYALTVSLEQKTAKIEINIPDDSVNSLEFKFNEHINGDMSSESIGNFIDDQVVIPNDNKSIKQRILWNSHCPNCQQKFKTKSQLHSHLSKCQHEPEQSEHNHRRHYSKNESLLISLLKQEAIIEKKQDIPLSKISTVMKTTSQKLDLDVVDDDDIVYDPNGIQLKLEKKDPDFVMKKQKNSKKTSTKNQSMSTLQSPSKSLPPIICTICGEANMINDELIRCSTCQKSTHAYKCLNFENKNIIKTIKTYSWQCIDCKKCIQCGTVEHDDELLFCDYCDRAYHMDCLNPPLNEPPPGAWYCQLCV